MRWLGLGATMAIGLGGPATAFACEGEACVAPCDDGEAEACGKLAQTRWKAGERQAAFRLHIRACEGKHLPSCMELGALFALPRGDVPPAKDLAVALDYYRQACNGGYLQGCLGYGEMLAAGGAGDPAPKKASKVWSKLCDKGAPSNYFTLRACYALGGLYERGEGVKADPAEASRLYQKGCKGKMNPDACEAAERMGS